MSIELIISIISLIATTIIGIFTIVANIKISKINHLKDVHEYERRITYFELQYKDELWLANLLESGEFNKYSLKSQKKIFKWFKKYQEKHPLVLLKPEVDYTKLGTPFAMMIDTNWRGSQSKDNDDGSDGGEENIKDLF